jgi:hypothetical protein
LLAGALQHQVCELQRLLGKKTLESVILHEVLYLAQPKTAVALAFAREGRHAKKTVSDTLAVACSKPGSTSSRRTTPAARSPGYNRMRNSSPRSKRSSPVCRPAAIGGFTR